MCDCICLLCCNLCAPLVFRLLYFIWFQMMCQHSSKCGFKLIQNNNNNHKHIGIYYKIQLLKRIAISVNWHIKTHYTWICSNWKLKRKNEKYVRRHFLAPSRILKSYRSFARTLLSILLFIFICVDSFLVRWFLVLLLMCIGKPIRVALTSSPKMKPYENVPMCFYIYICKYTVEGKILQCHMLLPYCCRHNK